MDFDRSRFRTIGEMPRQDHGTRRLLFIIGGVTAGLIALFGFAYLLANADANFDNQELPPATTPTSSSPGASNT